MLGLEFGTAGDRLDRLEEACQVIKSLWTQPRTTFAGRHYQLADALSNPKPVQQPHPPLWIGGSGRRRTLRIAAQYADAWNGGGSPQNIAELNAVLDQHCADVGRDPAQILRTAQIWYGDSADKLPQLVEEFGRVGVGEVIIVIRGGNAVDHAERIASLLPALRGD